MPLFFLSYGRFHAHEKDEQPDPYVKKFFDDLVAEIGRLSADHTPGEVGFLDVHSLKLGDNFGQGIREALGNCKAFVALYSDHYFKSDYCGIELQAFLHRLRDYARKVGTPDDLPPLFFPVRWEYRFTVPEPVSHVQYDNARYGEKYRTEGLRFIVQRHITMVKNGIGDSDYPDFVRAFAKDIIERVAKFEAFKPSPVPPLRELGSAFRDQKS
jgi:hypothetical protein